MAQMKNSSEMSCSGWESAHGHVSREIRGKGILRSCRRGSQRVQLTAQALHTEEVAPSGRSLRGARCEAAMVGPRQSSLSTVLQRLRHKSKQSASGGGTPVSPAQHSSVRHGMQQTAPAAMGEAIRPPVRHGHG